MIHSKYQSFILIIVIIFLGACRSEKKQAPFYELNRIVSFEAEQTDSTGNWVKGEYYTGYSMISFASDTLSDSLGYTLELNGSGTYDLWLLTRKLTDDPNTNTVKMVFETEQQRVISRAKLGELDALEWVRSASLNADRPGTYHLSFHSEGIGGIAIDKIMLSADPNYKPKGYGLPETDDPLSDVISEGSNDEIILPPAWAFGILYGGYTDQDQTIQRIRKLRKGNYPIDAFWIDSWFWDFNNGDGPGGYIDFKGDTSAFYDMKALWDFMEDRNIKSGIWIWNGIQQVGNEEVYAEFMDRGFFSSTYLNTDGWHNEIRNTMIGDIDFSNPAAVKYWKSNVQPFFDQGVDFLKLDRSSGIPFTKAAFEATQELGKESEGRGFVLAHLHSTYDPEHKKYPTKWTGDAKIAWSQPDYPDNSIYAMGGYKENIGMIADPRRTTYEIPFLTHDTGGYNFFGSEDLSDELYMRWTQFGMMNSITTFFSASGNETSNMPFNFSKEAQDNFRKYAHLKLRLFPYIYTYAHNTRTTGNKMIQGDGVHEYQYLLGEELLIAPVYQQGARDREVFLPEGTWYNYWTGERYNGNKTIRVNAPLNVLPMMVKAGAIIPMRQEAANIESGSNDTLQIHIYAGANGSFDLIEDDGVSNDYLKDQIARTPLSYENEKDQGVFTIEKSSGSYTGMKPNRLYELHFHHLKSMPQQALWNGDKVSLFNENGIVIVKKSVPKNKEHKITLFW